MTVSVILTSYNQAKYIHQAIDSVLNQTYTDFEFLIWDDASTDNSWDIIESYRDERIKVFRNETSKRGIHALNKGILEETDGKYIAVHHADDVWEPTKLEKQVAYLESHPDIGAVFTNAMAIDENGATFEDKDHFYYSIFNQPNRSRYEWLNFFFYQGNALCHPSVLIRKECYDECGLYRFGLAQIGDFDMWIRLCMKYDIHVIPDQLVRFRVRENEANSSGNTPVTRIRRMNEHFIVTQNFSKITSKGTMRKIFPRAEKYMEADGFVPEFILAMMALENNSWRDVKLFGLSLLYELINDREKSRKIKELYDFDYLDLVSLSGKHDVFNVEELNNNVIRLFIDCGEGFSGKNFLEQYVSPHDKVQTFVFDLTEQSDIRSLRCDLLDESCIVYVEKVALIGYDGAEIDLMPELRTNALIEAGDVYYFDTEGPQIQFNAIEQDVLSGCRSLCVQIKYLYFGKEALAECVKELKHENNKFLKPLLAKDNHHKVVFFGASGALEKQFDSLLEHRIVPDYICDNDIRKHGQLFRSVPVRSPDEVLCQDGNFYVLITSSYIDSIKHQLQKYKNIVKIVSLTDIKEQFLKKAIFIHIQKTAGSTMVDLIRQTYGNGQVVSHGDFVDTDRNILKHKDIAFVSGHFGFEYAAPLIKDRFSFTFLREPRDRVISLYYYARSSKDKDSEPLVTLAKEASLEDFLVIGKTRPEIATAIRNHQTRQLAIGWGGTKTYRDFENERDILEVAKKHLDMLSFVGLTETFEQDRDIILRELGIEPPAHKVVVNATGERLQLEDLPQSTLSVLDELVNLDNELYYYALSKRNRI
ncbi:MAG: glycosyltransferase [Sulfuricurvum sp.]|uniref:glycosyltransferase n=1 Tax=Sulfuricurvum sp. TaxID=2025608 RepID=UPI003D12D288